MIPEVHFISERDESESVAEPGFGHFHLIIPAVRLHQECRRPRGLTAPSTQQPNNSGQDFKNTEIFMTGKGKYMAQFLSPAKKGEKITTSVSLQADRLGFRRSISQ
jgi:hypothetical protein